MISLGIFLLLIVLLLLGTPMVFAMGLSAIVGILVNSDLNLLLVPERIHSFADSFVFIAIPLFILSGSYMERSGITKRLMDLALAMVGPIRGGLAMVTVIAEMLFSGISGSTVADVSAMCSMVMPALKKAKYSTEYSIAVISASSAMGILIPPCIGMIVIGGLANISVAALFIGGLVPAAVLAAMLMLLIYADARRLKFPAEPRVTLKQFARIMVESVVPLGMPIIIFGGILGGIFTPTEAAGVTVLYAVAADVLLYRSLGWRDVLDILVESASVTGLVMFIVAAASILSYLFSYMKVPEQFSELLLLWNVGPIGFMFITTALFLVASFIIEPIPAMVIFIPVLYPIAVKLGINLVHFGIVIIAALGVGTFIPPIGMGLILACSIGKVSMHDIVKPIFPFIVMLLLGLVILIMFPKVTTFLPDMFLD